MEWLLDHWEQVVALMGALTGALALSVKAAEARRAATVTEAAAAVNGYAQLCTDLQEERGNLNGRIDALEQRQQSYEQRIDALNRRIADLERELAQTRGERDEERARRMELEHEVAALRRELNALKVQQAAL